MTDEEQSEIAERFVALGLSIAGLMDYLASLGVGSHSGAAAHLRRLADLVGAEEFPVVRGAMLRVADHIEHASGTVLQPGELGRFADPDERPGRK